MMWNKWATWSNTWQSYGNDYNDYLAKHIKRTKHMEYNMNEKLNSIKRQNTLKTKCYKA